MHGSLNSQEITGLYTNNKFFVRSIQESHSKFSTAIKQTNLFGESTNTGTGPQEATGQRCGRLMMRRRSVDSSVTIHEQTTSSAQSTLSEL